MDIVYFSNDDNGQIKSKKRKQVYIRVRVTSDQMLTAADLFITNDVVEKYQVPDISVT